VADPAPDSDDALVADCVAGGARAIDALVERHGPVMRLAIRTALTRAGAGLDVDLAEEAFARVIATLVERDAKVLRSFGGRSRLGTFLAVVARRTAMRLLEERRPLAERALRVPAEAVADAAATEAGPFERAAGEEEREIVRKAVAALAPRDALALRLFYERGLGHREIGVILKVPVTHVGQILARAREKLREPLDRAGLGEDARNDDINVTRTGTNPGREG
jgi:RNA polymerase sigma factor (sigma-70 family)